MVNFFSVSPSKANLRTSLQAKVLSVRFYWNVSMGIARTLASMMDLSSGVNCRLDRQKSYRMPS